MQKYHGRCHCGAVTFSYEGESIERGLRCNCSICSRKGAMMTSEVIPPERFQIETGEESLGLYQFGDGRAKHFFCKRCGIYPFHETARFPGSYRANIGCLEGVDQYALEYDLFDGKHLL